MIYSKLYRCCFAAVVVLSVGLMSGAGQSNPALPFWRDLGSPGPAATVPTWVTPQKFRALELNHASLQEHLRQALPESARPSVADQLEIALPLPDGTSQRFRIVESPVMAPELAAKFPEIRTYAGQGIDDPAATVRLDLTPAGFHAQILSPGGAVYIDPHSRDRSVYACYYKRDYQREASEFQCLTPSGEISTLDRIAPAVAARSGTGLRTYRLACAATGEYTQFHGGNVSAGLAGIVTAINRVTGIYENDLAIRLQLVANNDLIVYTNPNTDPYSNNNASSLLMQNQSNLDSVIGNANYDIGHVFSTAGGGLAGLGVVCVTGNKARGETGLPSPVGDPFFIDFVAHEMGHQFGANHTFNGSAGNCGGNRNASTAYEIGSGSTIMAYAGICSSDNLQPNSDPYFHSISFDEILAYSTAGGGSGCAVVTATSNSVPTVDAGADFAIPASTPFLLTASGSDANGDLLTYCWEQRDLGPSTSVTASDNGSSPLFRSFNPTTNAWRSFPKLSAILNNTASLGENLPTTSRTMNFRVTVRDNRAGGGGVNTDDMQVTVVSDAGPFLITSHNSGGVFSNATLVTWDVAGTTAAPINAANVNILLSTDGGQTFPNLLLANAPNDGSQTVVLPNINTSQARLKVEAAGNIFFDINNADFTIVPGVPTPQVSLDATSVLLEECTPANGAIDPGETVTINVALRNTGSADTTNLVATLLPSGGVTVLSGPQDYGVLAAGGAAVARSFSLTASGTCAGVLSASLQLQDGAASLGMITADFILGSFVAVHHSFTNNAAVSIPATGKSGPASSYPSTIAVSSVAGTVAKVTVTLAGLTHSWPDDLDFLLVGPTGQKALLMSDAGGGTDVNDVTLTFDDNATSGLPDSGAISSGTYRPSNFDSTTDALPSPAPAGPHGQALSVFAGTNPNGTWSLYMQDDQNPDSGELLQGWQLNVTIMEGSCCTGTPIALADVGFHNASASAIVNLGDELQFDFTVTNRGPDAAEQTTVSSVLPAGLSFLSASTSQGMWTNSVETTVFDLGTLNAGGVASISVQAVAVTSGIWTNSAQVISVTEDPVSVDNVTNLVTTVNTLPVISPIADQSIAEDTATMDIPFTVGDVETTAESLELDASSSDTNIIALADILFGGSGSNRTVTIVPVTNASGSATVTITVADGFGSAQTSFMLTVMPVNDPPVLSPIPDQMIVEGETLWTTNTATDVDSSVDELTFSLLSAPATAIINPTNGLIAWTTGEVDGPGTNEVSVVVTDSAIPSLSATQSFTVIVLETNIAPLLAAVPDRTFHAGTIVIFTNSATDADLPANQLTFSLDAGAPLAATVDPVSGIFEWATSDADAGTTNLLTVRVTDDGVPIADDAQSFALMVLPRPVITSVALSNGLAFVSWSSIADVHYQLQQTTNLPAAWADISPAVVADGDSSTMTNAVGSEEKSFYRVLVLP